MDLAGLLTKGEEKSMSMFRFVPNWWLLNRSRIKTQEAYTKTKAVGYRRTFHQASSDTTKQELIPRFWKTEKQKLIMVPTYDIGTFHMHPSFPWTSYVTFFGEYTSVCLGVVHNHHCMYIMSIVKLGLQLRYIIMYVKVRIFESIVVKSWWFNVTGG